MTTYPIQVLELVDTQDEVVVSRAFLGDDDEASAQLAWLTYPIDMISRMDVFASDPDWLGRYDEALGGSGFMTILAIASNMPTLGRLSPRIVIWEMRRVS